MTAQAPYESPVSDVMVTAYLSAVHEHLGNLTTEEWATDRANPVASLARVARIGLTAALAALPERAPVSAGGDALLQRARKSFDALMKWRSEMPAVWYGNPAIDEGAAVIDLMIRALATPAPPVGADWVMVPRVMTDAMREAAEQTDIDVYAETQQASTPQQLWDAMLSAAPTPAEARGVGDGVRATTPEEAVIADAALRLGVIARDLVARFERQHPRAVKLLRKGEPFFVVKASEPYAWELVRLIRAHEGDGWTAECQEWAEEAIGSPEPNQAQAQGSEGQVLIGYMRPQMLIKRHPILSRTTWNLGIKDDRTDEYTVPVYAHNAAHAQAGEGSSNG